MYYLHQIVGSQCLANKLVYTNSDMMYSGIVSGNNTGVIWADDISNPAFCMVWSEHLKGFHFIGRSYSHISKDDFHTFIDDTIIPFLCNKKIHKFEFSCDSHTWISFICELFSNREIKRYKQYFYKLLEPNNLNKDINLPTGYEVFEINEDFIFNKLKNFENQEIIQFDIKENWGNISKFIELGKGYLAVQNNTICSYVSTRFRYKDNYCIGVDTYDPHKRKGLSSFLSTSLFNNIIKHNGNIWWDCSAENVASQKTACKTGLTFLYEYEVLWFNI